MSRVPCSWPGCTLSAKFHAMCSEEREGRRITYYRIQCASGHRRVDWSANRPNHVLANLRGHAIRG